MRVKDQGETLLANNLSQLVVSEVKTFLYFL